MLNIFRSEWDRQKNCAQCLTWPAKTDLLLDQIHKGDLTVQRKVQKYCLCCATDEICDTTTQTCR